MQQGKTASLIIVAFDIILAIVRLGVEAWPLAIGFAFILSLIWCPHFWAYLIPFRMWARSIRETFRVFRKHSREVGLSKYGT